MEALSAEPQLLETLLQCDHITMHSTHPATFPHRCSSQSVLVAISNSCVEPMALSFFRDTLEKLVKRGCSTWRCAWARWFVSLRSLEASRHRGPPLLWKTVSGGLPSSRVPHMPLPPKHTRTHVPQHAHRIRCTAATCRTAGHCRFSMHVRGCSGSCQNRRKPWPFLNQLMHVFRAESLVAEIVFW